MSDFLFLILFIISSIFYTPILFFFLSLYASRSVLSCSVLWFQLTGYVQYK